MQQAIHSKEGEAYRPRAGKARGHATLLRMALAKATATMGLLLVTLQTQIALAVDPLFLSEETLAITLVAPFEDINRERDKNLEYLGELHYIDEERGAQILSVKLSVRGGFRLQKDVCSNSQLWVNFRKSEVKGTLFAGQDKVKLLVRCRDSNRYSDLIAREHQAYQIFASLSDISFATRLLTVTYEDSATGKREVAPAMFIEHQKRLAKTHNMRVFDGEEAPREALDGEQSTLLALFNFMIANTDFSMISGPEGETCCHNVKLLESDSGALYPVPYDFDSSGYVFAPYAEASGGIGQRSLRDRIYRGYCTDPGTLNSSIERVRSTRSVIEGFVTDHPLASKKGKRNGGRYLQGFYEFLEDPAKVQRDILGACRN